MDMEKQSLVVVDKGKKPLDSTSSDVVVDNDWHQVKDKWFKGKSMNMQCNCLPTTCHDIVVLPRTLTKAPPN